MERWPGHERQDKTQIADKPKDKGKQQGHRLGSSFWQWPHVEHGSIGRATLVSKGGRVRWSTVVNTSHGTRWLPLGVPTKVFPETRLPEVNLHEHSTRQRAEKGLQYLRTYFPDAEFPNKLLGSILETDAREMRHAKAFDPFLGNLLEIIPSHLSRDESTVAFPMGKLGRELNISRFGPDGSGDVVFQPAGSPSFLFETPILQVSSVVGPPEWIATSFSTLLIRTHASSSLLRLEHSNVTREVDITRSEVGDVPIVDSRILASGSDIVVVNRSGRIYKCTTYCGGKAMQFIGAHETSNEDHFWQLGATRRNDECFLTSCKSVKHIDLRSANSVTDAFSLDHPDAVVTSFESPMHDCIGRITTTSDVIWLDDRFPRRPLLSFKHYRGYDRTLRVLTANLSGASFSLLTSRRNGLVTLYDVGGGSDNLLHCNSSPSCLPHDESMSTTYGGDALVVFPSNVELTFFRLSQRGSIRRQDIRRVRPDRDQPGSVREGRVTHKWDEDVQTLEKHVDELQIDFGPAAGKHYTEVNLRDAYEEIFSMTDAAQQDMDQDVFNEKLARLPDILKDMEETPENMLTTFEVISGIEDRNKCTSHNNFLTDSNINSDQAFDALMHDGLAIQKLAGHARWHYNIQNTSIPGLNYPSANYSALDEYLKELNLVSGVEGHDPSARRETEARRRLVLDLALSHDVYSARPVPLSKLHSSAASEAASNTVAQPTGMLYSEEPPEVTFGYFRPVRKSGADHYADKDLEGEQEPGVSSPLGVRLLLAEWELGTNPDDYTYRDPYGLADIDAQPIPQYRRPSTVLPTTQKRQMAPQQPPLVVPAAIQPLLVHAVERAPPLIQSQPVQHTHSRRFETNFDAFSQQPMASTQIVPGPFGGRPGAGKPVKKRIGGF